MLCYRLFLCWWWHLQYYELRNLFLFCVIKCTMQPQLLSAYRTIRSCVKSNVFRNFEAQMMWPWLSDGHFPDTLNLTMFSWDFFIVMPFSQRTNVVFIEIWCFLSMFWWCSKVCTEQKKNPIFILFLFILYFVQNVTYCIFWHFFKCGVTGLYFYSQLKQTWNCLLNDKKELIFRPTPALLPPEVDFRAQNNVKPKLI